MSTEILSVKVIKGTMWLTVSQILGILFGTVAVIVLTRLLGPTVYGYLPLITSLTGIGLIFGDAGLGAGTAYFVAQHRIDSSKLAKILHHALRIRLVSVLPFLLLFAAILLLCIPFMNAPLLLDTWIFIAVLLLFLVQVLSRWIVKVFEGLGETRYSGMVQAALGWLSPLGQVALVVAGFGLMGAVFAQLAGNSIIIILLFIVLYTKFMRFPASRTPVTTRMIVNYSLPLMLLNGTAFIYSASGPLIVKWIGSIQDVSYYGLASQIVTISQIPALAFASATAPVVAAEENQNIANKIVRNGIRLLTIAYAPIVLYTAIASTKIIHLVFTESYGQTARLLCILQPYLLASALAAFFSLLWDYCGMARKRLVLVGAASVMFLGLAVFAGFHYGPEGVALAAVVTYLPLVACYGYFVSIKFSIEISFYYSLWTKTLVALAPGAIVLLITSHLFSSIGVVIAMILSGLAYLFLAFRLNLLNREDCYRIKAVTVGTK